MDSEPALRRIEEAIGPFIGRHMAKASIQVQCQRLGVNDGKITTQQLQHRDVGDGHQLGKAKRALTTTPPTKDAREEARNPGAMLSAAVSDK